MKSFAFPFVSGRGDLPSNGHLSHRCVASCNLECHGLRRRQFSPSLPPKLPLARIMYFAEQVALAKPKILSVSQANSKRTAFYGLVNERRLFRRRI